MELGNISKHGISKLKYCTLHIWRNRYTYEYNLTIDKGHDFSATADANYRSTVIISYSYGSRA